MHWWCGLGEASGGEGAETNLTEGPQETAPVGQKDSLTCVMTCWGLASWAGGPCPCQKLSQ